jgi:type IX secretion system PorP/SprF family membrane protein
MKKIFLLSLLLLLVCIDAQSQQDPHYTQYMYNMNIINPAYAGSKENLSFGLLYRKQWVNIDGAPTTFTASGSAPVGKNVGAGLSIISDVIGPVKEQNIYGDFSYTLNIGEESHLAFGVKAGVTFQQIGLLSEVGLLNPITADDAFGADTNNKYLNIGTGLFYYTDKYYVAFSVPNMLKSKHLDYNGKSYGSETSHYFLTGGYVFDLSPMIKFKPFAMMKFASNFPLSIDYSANFLYDQKFEFGLTYRRQDSYGAMVNFAITPNLKIGYAYDAVRSDLKVFTPASHEFILLYDLSIPKRVSRSPRFF